MRGIILGIFSAIILVIVFNQVFKDCGVEVVFLDKDVPKAEFNKFVNKCTAESITLLFLLSLHSCHILSLPVNWFRHVEKI